MTSKRIKRAHPAMRDDIADLTTRRPVPGRDVEQIDPFLFLNHHGPQVYAPRNRGLPFGPHPHRGFETVTFILTGELAHRDSAGHESVIKEGGIQWMTAGSGLVHAEISPQEFMQKGGPLEILQLWVNLPPKLKMTQPRYIGLQRDEIPAIATPDGKGIVNLVSGEYLGRKGAMQPLLDIFMSTVELRAGARVAFPGVAKRNVFLYVVRGSVEVGRPNGSGVAPDRARRRRRHCRDRGRHERRAALRPRRADRRARRGARSVRDEHARRDHAGDPGLSGGQVQRDSRRAPRLSVSPRTRRRDSRPAAVRNVIFDFGGVLVTWRPQEIIDSFYSDPALREALRTHAFQHDDWLAHGSRHARRSERRATAAPRA